MSLKIRLSRLGRRSKPFYRLVLAYSKSKRICCKKKFGFYDPLLPDNKLFISDPDSLRKYIKCGAQLTDRVRILLNKMKFDFNNISDTATIINH